MVADCMSRETPACLIVIDLTETWRQWEFQLPSCIERYTEIFSMDLLCEPGPGWRPPAGTAIPFHVSRKERLIVLMLGVSDDRAAEDHMVSFSMLTSKLLQAMKLVGEEAAPISWAMWGKWSCRVTDEHYWDDAWPCCVYGTKLISHDGKRVVIRDFNPYTVKEALATGNVGGPAEEDTNDRYIVSPSRLELYLRAPAGSMESDLQLVALMASLEKLERSRQEKQ